MGSPEGTKDDPQALLIAARDLVAFAVENALERVERVDDIMRGATAELAESLLAIETAASESNPPEVLKPIVDERVSTSMRALQFEDICTQILSGTLADLARLAEGFEALVVVEDQRPVAQRLDALKTKLAASLSKVPDQTDVEEGESLLF